MPDLPEVTQPFDADGAAYLAFLDDATAKSEAFALAVDGDIAKVAEFQAALDGLHGGDVHVGMDLGDGVTVAALADTLARIDDSGTMAAVTLDGIRAALDGVASASPGAADGEKAVSDGAAVATYAAYGFWGILSKINNAELPLFGGILDGVAPKVLAVATGTHMLVDGLIETVGVLVPAAIAFTVFGAAAVPTLQAVYQQMLNVNTVEQATGATIYPLSGGFAKLAASVQPQVYQLLGDALTVAGHGTGEMTTLAQGAGDALDVLAARFVVAETSGKGFGGFLANADSDLANVGTLIGNIGGILGNFFKVVPGYAEDLLMLADGATHVAESFTGWTPVQDALKTLLLLHGGVLYAGIGVTVLSRMIPGLLGGISGLALKGATAPDGVEALGAAGEAASAGMFGLALGAEKAAGLPWGWILTAAAGVGILVYAILSAKDATQAWLGSMQSALDKANAIQGVTDIEDAQVQVASRLADAQTGLAHTSEYVSDTNLRTGLTYEVLNPAYTQAQRQVADLTSGQRQLTDETDLYNFRVGQLAKTYGSTSAAQAMLVAAGVPMSMMLDKSSESWAQIKAMVEGTANAYRAMGQIGGTLGADMSVLNTEASSQYQDMSKLNQAWSTFLGLSQSLISSEDGVVTGMRALDAAADKTKASFDGADAKSITLRDDFEQMVPTIENVIGGMRQGGSSAKDMAEVLSTDLKPAVDAGALANSGLRQQIYDMAREAGFAGPDSIAALKRWVDANNVSTRTAIGLADGEAGALGHLAGEALSASQAIQRYISWLHQIPANVQTQLNVNENLSISEYRSFASQHGGFAGGTPAAPAGLHWVGEHGPELLAFRGGEQVIPHARSVAMASAAAGSGAGSAAPSFSIGDIHIHGNVLSTKTELYGMVQDAVLDAWTRFGASGMVPYGRAAR